MLCKFCGSVMKLISSNEYRTVYECPSCGYMYVVMFIQGKAKKTSECGDMQ